MRQLSLMGGVLGSVYLIIAMSTYVAADPAFSHTGEGEVVNAAGPAGAWLADVVFQVFGYGGWALSGLVVFFGLKMGGRTLGGWMTGLASSLSLWSVLTAIALVSPGTDAAPFPPGGYIGLLSSEALNSIIGPAGSWILVTFCLLGAAPFVLGVDWEKIVGGALSLVESKLPAAARRITAQVRGWTMAGYQLTQDIFQTGLHRLMHALPKRPVGPSTGASDDDEAYGAIGIEIAGDGPTVGTIHTPTVAPREVFDDVAHGLIEVPVEEDEPVDKTVVQMPELVEVEWGTEAGVDVSQAASIAAPVPEPTPTYDPISLDSALLAAAVHAPEPTFMPLSESGVPLSEPGLSGPGAPGMMDLWDGRDEPALDSDPEEAPTAPPFNEPEIHEEVSLEIVRLDAMTTGETGPVITPGELISGGAHDDGRAIVVPDIRTPYELPHLDLLDKHPRDVASFDRDELTVMGVRLTEALANFKVSGEVVAIRPGPVITTFEFKPAPGIKVSKIAGLQDDIAMALKALRVRIIAPIPETDVVGIEIPSATRQIVWIRDMLASSTFREGDMALPMALGKTVDGRPRIADLAKMPHLLVGGTTGSGKSVGVNSMLLSMLYMRTPEELRMILVDPKMLEFEMYREIPHLLHPVVTEPKLASAVLKWACVEMDDRYRQLTRWKVRNVESYNAKVERELKDWTPAKARKYAPKDWTSHELPPPP
ncbi:MAG: DNA translocase FtsK, partial [Deltaproteobacteria bacterium]|nr:DNA translocase FtsK [Deltaproteobacteria bacterium]